MTNLEKLKEVLPDLWSYFSVNDEWANEEYNPTITTTNIINYYFGDDNELAASETIWDMEYKIKNEDNFN